MFWTAGLPTQRHKIQRANLDGSNVRDLVTGLGRVENVAVDRVGRKIYWTDIRLVANGWVGKIQCADLNGFNARDLLTGLSVPDNITLDVSGGRMYWGEGSKIRYADLEGSNVRDLVTGLHQASGIALGIPPGTPVVPTPTPKPTPTPTPRPTVSDPSRITISGSATRSEATVNQQLDAPLLVRVLDDGGNGVADVKVIFRVTSGRGKVSERGNGRAITVQTDRSGYASADFTPLEEGTLTVQASATGVTQTVEFTITTGVAPTSIVPITTKTVVTTHPHPSIYWPDWDTGKIHHVDLDGSNVRTLVTGAGYPSSTALDIAGEKIYWTNSGVRFVTEVKTPNGKIQCADLDGSNIRDLVTGLEFPYRMALDIARGKMYWTGENKIQRANLDGSNVQDIVTGVGEPISIALDVAGGKIYWTD